MYCAESIRRHYAELSGALAGIPHRIDYAVKANSSLAVMRVLRELGAGCDIVSGGELFLARTAGFDPADIVFSGVGKAGDDLPVAEELLSTAQDRGHVELVIHDQAVHLSLLG